MGYMFVYVVVLYLGNINSAHSMGEREPKRGIAALLPRCISENAESSPEVSNATSGPWGGIVRFGVDSSFPTTVHDCSNNWQTAFGRYGVMIRILADYVGNWTCTDFTGHYDINETNEIYDEIDIYGSPTHVQSSFKLSRGINTYTVDHLCLLVRRNPKYRGTLLQSFSLQVWLVTLITLVSFIVSRRFIDRNSIPLETIQTFISGSFVEHHGKPIANFLSVLLSVFGLIMTSAFNGCFLTFLLKLQEAKQINTISEVANSVSTALASHVGFVKFFTVSNLDPDDPMLKLTKMFKHVHNLYDAFEGIKSGESVLVNSRDLLEFYRHYPIAVNADGHPMTHIVKQCVISPSSLVFPVASDKLYLKKLEKVILRLVDSGIIQTAARMEMYLTRRYIMERYKYPLMMSADQTESDEPRALKINNMIQPGIILFCGLLISTFTMIGEIITTKRRNCRLCKK